MSPIIGVIDSAKTGNLTPPTGYFALATATVASGTSLTLSFTDIPQTFTDLEIRLWCLNPSASGDITLRFNGDSGASYSLRYFYTSGSSTIGNQSNLSTTYIPAGLTGGPSIPAQNFIKIPDYTNTNKNKTARAYGAADQNGGSGNYYFLHAGKWGNTAAITSITLGAPGNAFATGSYATLYGIK
jgi:hypothetical protein